jgi:hypothetical protein
LSAIASRDAAILDLLETADRRKRWVAAIFDRDELFDAS